jgi:hypothetical protein
MPREFFFEPSNFDIPTVSSFREKWARIPNSQVRDAIAVENQYLQFHVFMLFRLRHRTAGSELSAPVGLSLRAGAIKTTALLCGSIAEAALRAHAEHRKYKLPTNPRHRTFGKVLQSWQDTNGAPKADVAPIWHCLQGLHGHRNSIHLYKGADEEQEFYDFLKTEHSLVGQARTAIKHLRTITS